MNEMQYEYKGMKFNYEYLININCHRIKFNSSKIQWLYMISNKDEAIAEAKERIDHFLKEN